MLIPQEHYTDKQLSLLPLEIICLLLPFPNPLFKGAYNSCDLQNWMLKTCEHK